MTYPINTPERRALIEGGKAPAGDPDDELLEDGQEEVFSRTEVERGEIEHRSWAGEPTRPGD
ncbi:MAG: hypothetical protein IT546_13445 [Caulobacteraceae bacterium]|nr:hypothetical protein [Caulobacteraceae bacterium]